MSADGPNEKTKNETAWGYQCSDWAKRAGFTGGMGLHAARREALIKVDDGGYSLGQVMKFAAHRNSKTLVGHYLDDMSNVDGAAVFLGLEPRRDLTEDFRSASMKRSPDLQHSLPRKCLDELRQRRDFTDLGEQIDNLSAQITAAIMEKGRQELKAQRRYVYDQRQKLINEELAKYRRTQRRVHSAQCEVDDQGEWHRSYFDRVVRHMVPERDRLARTLPIAAPLRSPEGISALQDLIELRTNDSRVAYQEVLRPIGGCCPVPTCGQEMKDIVVQERWKHVYRCSKDYHEKQSGFAEFCFQCSRWITTETDWEAHCQDHIDNLDVPFRCEPVTFRHADSVPCPNLPCAKVLHSESDLWHHLGDIHSTHKPDVRKKRQRLLESSVIQPLCGSQPVAIDAERGIWEAEALLAKWKRGNTTWYLVKWKGFPHEGNTWEKRKDIGPGLVEEFEATYQGNHSGVRLLKKRVLRRRVEYLVEWKGRPESENSWEKEATVSRERIMEFGAS
ncbi:hypothetical protein BJ878DRAFT_420194 [Calycina marina]|uniref:Chromo domain-containing protein n=1 Tax=Calycina marina TaxID=1763456 RepID=A0A9P8CFC0_9HELO|nr:hypothetical protein BJ878DRAFT_420194 [Calycina marina]